VRGGLETTDQPAAVEDVVAQDQAGRIIADEVAADEEGLGESAGVGCTA
jgi:hypothetical protein